MREIEFRYTFKHTGTGNVEKKIYTLKQLEERNVSKLSPCFNKEFGYELISRDQYTGLTDAEGNKIYEGDIVQYLDGNEWSTESGYDCEEFDNHGAIFFDEECGRYDVKNKQGIGYDDLFDCGVDFKIIGNIYENPELLQGGNK
ncbi:hypothetical protein IBT50_25420 [Bacillus sp. S70]|uniref:YopX family protein n=1 Tax=unclassified Bacillus (in: firmicutes) TaxID=185979 RepID=UPI00190DCA85|nr:MULTISPECIES: YopX family protein [unclassified Bacillus (in: firmicutes)]MBJ9983551.1 hypothetical protein [Bacillus sp. S29]MBK0104703.1 hypothetical protein [Bacillus sp. S70]MBK0110049.1 hypothetical protein [Bacillus sp. S73]MBK0138830.1 hypothetical protein [Bacillus sp. S72]MBK0148020.1 hypothetical protein [Bacillus sp. S74]